MFSISMKTFGIPEFQILKKIPVNEGNEIIDKAQNPNC